MEWVSRPGCCMRLNVIGISFQKFCASLCEHVHICTSVTLHIKHSKGLRKKDRSKKTRREKSESAHHFSSQVISLASPPTLSPLYFRGCFAVLVRTYTVRLADLVLPSYGDLHGTFFRAQLRSHSIVGGICMHGTIVFARRREEETVSS